MNTEIPKIIHYCWFGKGELSELNKKCILSWEKYFPDYDIKEWNESNYDFNSCKYAKEAYKKKKWAFVSDYARFDILYNYGGLYFDTDVEFINTIDDIIDKGPFMGLEFGEFKYKKYDSTTLKSNEYNDAKRVTIELGLSIAPGLGLGVYKNHHIYKKIIDEYKKRSFINEFGRNNSLTVCDFITEILVKEGIKNINGIGLVDDINIYPADYFCPKDPDSELINITNNTRAIHHYGATWRTSVQAKIHSILSKSIQKYGKEKGRTIGRIIALPYSIINKLQQKGIMYTLKFSLNKILRRENND